MNGLNDWHIVDIVAKQQSDPDDLIEVQNDVLDSIVDGMIAAITPNSFIAFMVEGPELFNIAQVISDPYVLEEDLQLKGYVDEVILPAGEMVCDAQHWNQVPRATDFYFAAPAEPTTIPLKQIVATKLELPPMCDEKYPFPKNISKVTRRRVDEKGGARYLSDELYDMIADEINRRDDLAPADNEEDEEDDTEEEDNSDDDSATVEEEENNNEDNTTDDEEGEGDDTEEDASGDSESVEEEDKEVDTE